MYPTTPPGPALPPPPPTPPRRSPAGLLARVAGLAVGVLGLVVSGLFLFGLLGTPVVAGDDVAAEISRQLEDSDVPVTGVDCAEDLPAKVGESIRCTYIVDARPMSVNARVTAVDGNEVTYEITSS